MILELENLVKVYGATHALDRLDLAVPEGCLYAFLGPNGAGKTTTIRIVNGLTRPTSGQARIAGTDILQDRPGLRRLCGLAGQSNNLDGELTVGENLEFHGRLFSMPAALRRERSALLLDYVELADRTNSRVKTLSGGMKRRLMIARALLHQPRILFLDEPTAGLDPAIRRRIWNLIKKVRLDGITVFLTTHYIEEAEFLADRVGFLDQGRLVQEGTPEELIGRVGLWAVDRVGETDLETAYFQTRDEANQHIAASNAAFTVRRVNLEDAFLALTGRRVG